MIILCLILISDVITNPLVSLVDPLSPNQCRVLLMVDFDPLHEVRMPLPVYLTSPPPLPSSAASPLLLVQFKVFGDARHVREMPNKGGRGGGGGRHTHTRI